MLAPVIAILALLLFVGLLLLLLVAMVYGQLSSLRSRCESAGRQLELHLGRQCELVSQLANQPSLADGIAHDAASEACRHVATLSARDESSAEDPHVMQQLIAAQSEIQRITRQLLQIRDKLGSAKANGSVVRPVEELELTAHRVLFACQTYNDAAAEYNQARSRRPLRQIAHRLGFLAAPTFPEPAPSASATRGNAIS